MGWIEERSQKMRNQSQFPSGGRITVKPATAMDKINCLWRAAT
jgi:hypothetical protein